MSHDTLESQTQLFQKLLRRHIIQSRSSQNAFEPQVGLRKVQYGSGSLVRISLTPIRRQEREPYIRSVQVITLHQSANSHRACRIFQFNGAQAEPKTCIHRNRALNDVVRRIINSFYAPIADEAEPRWLVHQRQYEPSICNRHAANYQSGGYESFHIGRPTPCAVNFQNALPRCMPKGANAAVQNNATPDSLRYDAICQMAPTLCQARSQYEAARNTDSVRTRAVVRDGLPIIC
jgi:hypothetical protein